MAISAIIDAHHHLWNPVGNEPDIGYVWLKDIGARKPFGDPTPIQRDYLVEEFLAEPHPHRFAGSVHVQADGAIPDPVAETAFVQGLSDAANFPIAIVGFADFLRDDVAAILDRHAVFPCFRGVRQILSRLEDRPDISFAKVDYLSDQGWRDRFSQIGERGLTFDLQCYPEQMAAVAEFLAQHSKVPVIIDHAGSPWDQSQMGLSRWREGIGLLAQLPNTHVKLCGFGMFDHAWNRNTIQPIFDHLTETFGPKRMLFASNFPVDKLMRPYRALLSDMDHLTRDWPDADRKGFFGDNAKQVYRLAQVNA